ncbi:uncharacterized protein LOC114933850 [Nylanderia fulva]|uniref:uncharacterized protein LOC114933850 n=1 Tax=Nylanderia fulva TaxID=613905 RepID=UPI0010FAD9DF|nr:uncharacterized protein LOC114933850 [Nylanderia fulva]
MRDEKPTAYLHCLRALAGDQCEDAIIRSLLFEQLPEVARVILAICDTSDLQRLAEMADKALDAMRPMVAATQIVPAKSSNTQATTGMLSTLEESLNALTLQVSKMQKQLDRNERFRRSRSRGKENQPRTLIPAPTHTNKPEFCYYHNRFGANARKCQHPCTWTQGAKP